MSFILDALKKSENDRQRQTGPALFEVKVAPPKAGFPVWAVAIVALLVINMVIVGWLLLRRSSRSDEAAAQNTPPAAASQAAPTPAPTANTAPPPPPTNNTPISQNMPQQAYTPPPAAPDSTSQPAAMSRLPANASRAQPEDEPTTQTPHMADRDQNEPTLASGASNSGANAGAGTGSDTTANSADDYAPATEAGAPIFNRGHVKRGTESGLMLYQDLAVANGSNLPELRLDLHVYAAKPQDRFALVNMIKVHEGDALKGGVQVEAITPDGVILSHGGTKFLLPRE